MALSAASERVPECPESSGPRDNFVILGDRINFDYKVGVLQLEADFAVCSIIAVTEVDGAVLVAVPEALWDRQKAKRILPADALRKAVRVMVPSCVDEDRTSPEAQPSFKVWLGVLKPDFEVAAHFSDLEEIEILHGFPTDDLGMPKLPFAKALVAVARDHFEFATAEEPASDPGSTKLERRMSNMEAVLAELKTGLAQLRPAAPPGLPSGQGQPLPQALGAHPKAPASMIPAGVDPGVARQALQAGVSPDALGEMAKMLTGAGLQKAKAIPKAKMTALLESDEEEEEEEEAGGQDVAGLATPMEKAVVQMSKILGQLSKDKKLKKDRSLEALLDRAESGGALDHKDAFGGSSRSKAAALRSLRRMLVQQPELISRALEQRMEEDWTQAGVVPGASSSSVTARGWVEQRSKVQNFQVPVRAVWCLAGIWDALRQNKVEEAKARAALGVAAFDQLAVDKGSWLVASEVVLEDPPPFSSFATHRPLESWEAPHSRLIDERWLELFLAKLKDYHDYQEKKQKLVGPSKRAEDASGSADKDKDKDSKKKKKGAGKGNGKAGDDEKAPPS